MPTLTHAHIELNADGVPVISGTTMKLGELVAAHLFQGWNAEQLHEQFPYLTMGQIDSALSYFPRPRSGNPCRPDVSGSAG